MARHTVGGLDFVYEHRGAHWHVTVRGHGEPGQRPLLGQLALSEAELGDLIVGTTIKPSAQPPIEALVAVVIGQLSGRADIASINDEMAEHDLYQDAIEHLHETLRLVERARAARSKEMP